MVAVSRSESTAETFDSSRYAGQFENLSAAIERLAVAVPIALGLIFILLYMAFGQLWPALLIYLNIPFAAVGGVFLLALRGMPFSISAAVGFIALFGVAVLNGVVLLTTVKKLREQGKSPLQAAREGAESRLRAVVMTAAVAALEFTPMALSSNAGAEETKETSTRHLAGELASTPAVLHIPLGKKESLGDLTNIKRRTVWRPRLIPYAATARPAELRGG